MLIVALIIIPLSLLVGVAASLAHGRARPRDVWTAAALVILWLTLPLGWRHALSRPLAFALFPVALILSTVAVTVSARRAVRPTSR